MNIVHRTAKKSKVPAPIEIEWRVVERDGSVIFQARNPGGEWCDIARPCGARLGRLGNAADVEGLDVTRDGRIITI